MTALSPTDMRRLILWEWRYTLECQSFTRDEAYRLGFYRWLRERGRIGGRS